MITQTMCTSFKLELMKAIHDFTPSTGDTFKLALYTSSASLGADTTAYTTTGEASGTGYSAGGIALTVSVLTTGNGHAYASFSDAVFSTVTLTACAGLIYNSSKANRAVAVLDFGGNKTATAQNFTVQMPTADSSSSILGVD